LSDFDDSKWKNENFGFLKIDDKIKNSNLGKKFTQQHKNNLRGPRQKICGENNPFFGKKQSPENITKRFKPVLQYSIDGLFIKEWKSIQDAKDDLNINDISSCCNNKLFSAGGFIWKFKQNEIYNEKIDKPIKLYRKPVYQLTMDNILIKKWNSVKDAEKELKIYHISQVCNNKPHYNSVGGYKWKYEYHENNN